MAVKVGNVVVNFKTNLAAFETDMKQAARSLKSIGRDFSTAGKSLTTSLTVPIIAAGAAFGKFAVDMDEGLDTIRAGTGATGKALAAMGDNMRNVMKAVPQDVAQVSTAIADLNTRLGLAGKPLEEMGAQMLNLSRLTKTDVAQNVADATRVFGQWNVATSDQAKTLDRLFVASQSSGIGVDKLMGSVVQYGAQLKSFGFTLDQSTALLAQWEKSGVNAEGALAGFSQGLKNFVKAGKDPLQGLKDLQARMLAVGDEGKAMGMALEAFGSRSGAVLGRALLENRMDIDAFAGAIRNSSETINKAAADTMSFSEKMGQFRNRIVLAAEPLGNTLLKAFEKMTPYLEKSLELVASLGRAFAALPGPVQLAAVGIAGFAAALGPMLMLVGSSITGLSAMLPILGKLGVAMGAGGLAAAAVTLGGALAAVGAAFAAWKLYERHQEMKAHWASMAEGTIKANEYAAELAKVGIHIDKNGLSAAQWIDKIGRLKAEMENSKSAFEQFNIGWKMTKDQIDLARISFEEATGKITKETAAMLRRQIENLRALETGAHGAAGGFDDLSGSVDTANEALEAFNASYWESFKGAENIPRAPWDTRIIQLEDYFGKLREITIAEDAALKAREAVASPLENPILTNLSGDTFEDFVKNAQSGAKEVAGAFENLRKTQMRNSEAMSQFGQVVSTTLTNATQTIAEKVTAWMGPFRHFAKSALAALMEGLFNPLFKILTAVGNAIGTWLTGSVGKFFGGPGNTMGLGSMIKASLGIGAPPAGGAAAGGTTAGGTAAGGFSLASLGSSILAAGPYAALAIPAVFGGMALADWANGPNSYQAGAKEVKRDYGLNMSQKDIARFFSSMGVSEPEAWGQRWGLLRSPQFQQFALNQGQTADFSKLGPEWEAAYAKAQIGKWGDYNELFLNNIANESPGAIQMEDWYDKLTIPNQSGQSAQEQVQQTVSVKEGDHHWTIHIHAIDTSDFERVWEQKILPRFIREADKGRTGLREALARSVRLTQGAY